MEAQANVTELEKELSGIKLELSSLQKVNAEAEAEAQVIMNKTTTCKAKDLIKLEEELFNLRVACNDVRVQCEREQEVAKEHLVDIEKKCAISLQENKEFIELTKLELAKEIENAHRKKDLILIEANAEREKLLSNTEAEAQVIMNKATACADKALADVEKRLKRMKHEKRCFLVVLRSFEKS